MDPFIFPTSFAQQRLWFLDQFEPGKSVYHLLYALSFDGTLNVNALEQALKNAGIAISAAAQPDTQVRVSISENLQGPLLVAEIRTGDRRQTVFQPWTAARPPAIRRRLALERKPVWEQPEPVLDFARPPDYRYDGILDEQLRWAMRQS